MPITAQQALEVLDRSEVVADAARIEDALDRMALEMHMLLSGKDPLILCVMVGALVPAGMLLPRLRFPFELDYLHATRYRGGTRGGELEWISRPRVPLIGREVLVLDDILDEGVTLQAIVEDCRNQGASGVYSAVLVEKLHPRKQDLQADIVGLQVEDRYVFGCGMDYKGWFRQLPLLHAVATDDAAH